MKINVTKKDIKNGQPENIKCCAIALALRRTFKTNMKTFNWGIDFPKY